MPGIEFVGADSTDDADDDVLDTGPRRPVRRWVWVVAGLLVLAVAVGTVVASRSGDGAPSAASSTSPFPSIGPGLTTTAPAAQISALTSDGTSLFWIAGNRLFRAGPVGRASISTAISPTGGDFAELQLVPDPAERAIWVVSRGSADSTGGSGNVEAFAIGDLTRVVRASARSLIGGAAVLNGALYVLAGGQLLRATSTSSGLTRIASVDAQAHDLVAVQDTLLYVEGGNSSAIGRWTPSGVRKPTILDITDTSLAVVGSTVYVAGIRRGKDVLETLSPVDAGQDPQLIGQQGVATGLTGLDLVAAGTSSLLVLGTDGQGLELACVGVREGSGLDQPIVKGLVAATSANVAVLRGTVFQAVGGGVRPVSFPAGSCPG